MKLPAYMSINSDLSVGDRIEYNSAIDASIYYGQVAALLGRTAQVLWDDGSKTLVPSGQLRKI